LKLFFPESVVAEQGAVFVFLLYVLQSSVMVLFGIVPLYSLQLRFRDLLSVPQSASEAGSPERAVP
jgi:hypothetical protein